MVLSDLSQSHSTAKGYLFRCMYLKAILILSCSYCSYMLEKVDMSSYLNKWSTVW